MSRSEEKERSAVEVVKGNVKYSFKSLSISRSIPLYIGLSFITLAIVHTLETFFIPTKLVLIAVSSTFQVQNHPLNMFPSWKRCLFLYYH